MLKSIVCGLILVQSIFSTVAAAVVYVSISKTNLASIDRDSVKKLLRAEQLTWDNGNTVVLMIDDLQATNSEEFSDVLSMSKTKFMEFWRIKFFSGRALLPRQVKNTSAVVDLLAENPSAIYIRIGRPPDRKLEDDPNIRTVPVTF